MKNLPYFRWYPADAETDEKYAALNDQELGFFHRCLNRSWVNGALPADLRELAATMRVTSAYLSKIWPRVSRCFQERDGRLFNRRQEEERSYATSKSERATSAVRTRYERSTDDLPRARARADSDSVSDFESVSEKENDAQNFELSASREIVVRPPVPTFEDFWRVWWNKTAKADAQKAWPAAAHSHGAAFLIEQAVSDRARFEPTEDWSWRAKLHPATWLRGRRWEDQTPLVVAKSMSTADRVLAGIERRIANGENPL